MPRIDPQQLLSCLTPLLAVNGGIKSSSEVKRLANLMEKFSKKLVSKCIYLQILKCTETELLGQFMAAGGWNLVHTWLNDGVNSSNWPFVKEILEMLLLCPVDGNRLKSNHTPKIVKNLSLNTTQNAYITALSKKLVEQWLKIAHQEKQLLQQQQQQNGLNGTVTVKNVHEDDKNLLNNENKPMIKAETDLKVESSPENNNNNNNNSNNINAVSNGTVEEDSPKKSSENVKYKISNKDSGLVLSIKRSTSPINENDAKVLKSPDSKLKSEHKSKSSSSSSDKNRSKKSSSSSSSHKSSSSKSSHKDKDRSSSSHKSSGSSSSSSSSKDKHRDSSKSSSKHSSSSSRDKEKDREKRKRDLEKEQAEKDKETLSFLAPLPSNKLQRIPKRQHSENSENKSNEVIEKKKPSISIEVRKGEKPKTVKTVPSQFRNHGLSEEPPPPPSRKAIKKPTTTVPPVIVPTSSFSPTNSSKSISPPPSKKLHLDKAFEPDVPERAGGVKLIKPKPMLIESAFFFDALDASKLQNTKNTKKRKRLPSGSSSSNSQSKKDEPESPKIEAKPLKFYKDTLDENAEDEKTVNETTSSSPTKDIEENAGDAANEKTAKVDEVKSEESSEKVKSEESSENKDDEPEEKRPPGTGTGPDGPPGIISDPNFPRRKRPKRSIRWRSEEELISIRYFELDENERVNVTKTFSEQKQDEHTRERMMMRSKVTEYSEWHTPKLIDNVPDIPYGSKSLEAAVQAERERNTLQEMFFNNRSMYDTPHEPDPEEYDVVEPQIIPLEDVTGNPDSVTNFKDVQWPAPKGDQPQYISQGGFGNLFGNIGLGASITIPPAPVNPTINPLVGFNLGGLQPAINQDASPLNFMGAAIIQQSLQAPFMQPPPLIQNNYQSNIGFQNRSTNSGSSSNNYSSNNNYNNKYDNNNRNRMGNSNSGSGSNWVRGNANLRRGMCHQYQRSGFCRNQKTGCPYIHER